MKLFFNKTFGWKGNGYVKKDEIGRKGVFLILFLKLYLDI
jgi:hypothetical protein